MLNFSSRNIRKIDELFQLAEDNGIPIDEDCPREIKSMSVRFSDGSKVIGLSDDDSEYTKLERMAHEMGHCMTESFYDGYSPFEIRERHEYRANAWAIKEIIPFVELCKAVKKGYRDLWDLAEYFSVSRYFVEKAVDYHAQHGRTVPAELYSE